MRNVALALWLLASIVGVGLGACSDKNDPDSASAGEKGISSKTQNLEHCGNVVCRAGRECCNESCGICTEPDVECSAQICKPGDRVSALAPACGGKSLRPCPGDGRCVDDSGETCGNDDADCGGTCECAKSAECPDGSSWNASPQICGCELDDQSGSGNSGSQRDGGTGEGGSGSSNDGGAIGGDCGNVTCASGQTCCNESCGICAPPGAECTQQVCEPIGGSGGSGDDGGSGGTSGNGGGGSGGSNDAGNGGSGGSGGDAGSSGSGGMGGSSGSGGSGGMSGSGGTGGSAGSSPPPVQCGSTTCPAGQVCCDPSCSLCAPNNALCVQSSCSDPGPHPGDTCDLPCPSDQRCEYVAVTCVIAPCPPEPTCVPFVACAGKTGAVCPGQGSCVDDTSDSCDPQSGGADCLGKCICDTRILHKCGVGFVFNFSPSVCACVYDPIQCLPESPACTQ